MDSGFCLVILKILLMNNDVFSAQIHTEYNVTGTSQFTAIQCHRHFTVYRYAAHTEYIHVLANYSVSLSYKLVPYMY